MTVDVLARIGLLQAKFEAEVKALLWKTVASSLTVPVALDPPSPARVPTPKGIATSPKESPAIRAARTKRERKQVPDPSTTKASPREQRVRALLTDPDVVWHRNGKNYYAAIGHIPGDVMTYLLRPIEDKNDDRAIRTKFTTIASRWNFKKISELNIK